MIEIEAQADPEVAASLEEVVRFTCGRLGVERATMGLMVVGPEEMARINWEHRSKPEPTDVLAFPVDGPEVLEGWPEDGPPPAPTPWPGPDLSIDGFPIFKGPYGRITALDMKTGQQVWMAANGDGMRNHPLVKDLNLPPLGIPGRGAPLLTKTLLFIGEGSDAIPGTNRDHMHGRKFRAFDKATGKVVWETELPAGTTGAPITYMHQGKQYVVVAIGGRDQAPEFVAFALP